MPDACGRSARDRVSALTRHTVYVLLQCVQRISPLLSQKFPLSIYITLSHFERLLLPCRCSLNATMRMLMPFRNIYQEPTCIKGRAWDMPSLPTPTISYLVNPFQFVAGLQHTVPSLSLFDSCPAHSFGFDGRLPSSPIPSKNV